MIHQHSTCREKKNLYKDKKKNNHFLGIIMNLFQVLTSSHKFTLKVSLSKPSSEEIFKIYITMLSMS